MEENAAVIEKSYRRYKKVIVVTAHLGNWELGMSYLIDKGFSMAGVYAPYREDEVVEWIMSHRNPDVEWIPAARGAAKACINALEQRTPPRHGGGHSFRRKRPPRSDVRLLDAFAAGTLGHRFSRAGDGDSRFCDSRNAGSVPDYFS